MDGSRDFPAKGNGGRDATAYVKSQEEGGLVALSREMLEIGQADLCQPHAAALCDMAVTVQPQAGPTGPL